MTDLIPVRVGDCLCPNTPHADGDFVSLRPKLDLRGGFRVKRRALDLNKVAQARAIQSAYAAGHTVIQLAKEYHAEPSDIQDVIANKGEMAGLMATDQADLEINLAESYLYEGVAAWNLVDEDGRELEVTAENLRHFLFTDYARAEAAADTADDLYRGPVLDPLFRRALSSLPVMPTNGLTPPTNGRGQKRPKRSKRSSTTTSPMGDTAATT